jgi:hypothetical protein
MRIGPDTGLDSQGREPGGDAAAIVDGQSRWSRRKRHALGFGDEGARIAYLCEP